MQTLSQQVAQMVREAGNPAPVCKTFVRGDGRWIDGTTIIHMPNGDETMFCGLNKHEKALVIQANRYGGGRWQRNGSFTLFKKDMEV